MAERVVWLVREGRLGRERWCGGRKEEEKDDSERTSPLGGEEGADWGLGLCGDSYDPVSGTGESVPVGGIGREFQHQVSGVLSDDSRHVKESISQS
jgi:hypothetical protein